VTPDASDPKAHDSAALPTEWTCPQGVSGAKMVLIPWPDGSALIGSLMVSYVRARAEGLGLECKMGFMQRPERVVLTGLGALLCGIFGPIMEYNTIFQPILWFVIPLFFVALFSNITAFSRLNHCRKLLNKGEKDD